MKRSLLASELFAALLLAIPYSGSAQPRQSPFAQSDRPYVYAGLPQCDQPLTVLTNGPYIVGYDEQLKAPRWVAYRLYKIDDTWHRTTAPSRTGISFKSDRNTQAKVKNSDFTGIGQGVPGDDARYDRGHMAPNASIATRYGQDAQKTTFLLSNIAIQKHGVNAGAWAELEDVEARAYANEYTNVWVICGAIFNEHPTKFGPAEIGVPKAFYKLDLIDDGTKPVVQAVIMDQQLQGRLDLRALQKSVKDVEQATGLHFLKELPAEMQQYWQTNLALIYLPPEGAMTFAARQPRSRVYASPRQLP